MSSSLTPERPDAFSEEEDQGALASLNIGFMNSLRDKNRTNLDGTPAKKRGPKPNSRPALTRRQELNRQAQRTHRERKEMYIKSLEDEVLRLKEVFGNVSVEKQQLAEENKQLKDAMRRSGIQLPIGLGSATSTTGSVGSSSAFTPPFTQSSAPSVSSTGHTPLANLQQAGGPRPQATTPPNQAGIDYEQAGIDFVLTLERPCMEHLPWLIDRSVDTGSEFCGHAMMASCPPFLSRHAGIPFGNSRIPSDEAVSGQRTWELPKADLATLMHLSQRLDLDGEITPIMAWAIIMNHPRASEFQYGDFGKISEELARKMRCYGFGAVIEEFELRDAIENVLGSPPDVEAPIELVLTAEDGLYIL